MKPVDVNPITYIDFDKKISKEDPKLNCWCSCKNIKI